MKTIKQIADELGVSKTAIRKKMPEEVKTRFAETRNQVIYIHPEGEKLIRMQFPDRQPETRFAEVSGNQFPVVSGEVSTLISMLQTQLEVKDRQLETKDKQIGELTAALENTTASLRAAQALHAGTMQKQLASDEDQAAEGAAAGGKKKAWFMFWK